MLEIANSRRTPRSWRARRFARLAWLGGLVAIFWIAPAGAVVLDFETQTPGAPAGPIIEGDYTLTTPSVEPGGPFCPTPASGGCPGGGNGQFLMAPTGSVITLARTDGQPFDLESISYFAFLNVGLIAVDGMTSGGIPVSAAFPIVPGPFASTVLPATFDDVVSVTFSYPLGVLNFGLDDITVIEPPLIGTAGTLTLVADDRFVRASGQLCVEVSPGVEECDPFEEFTEAPAPPFAAFDETVSAGGGGFATQTSAATTARLEASGVARGTADLSGETNSSGSGDSIYDVSFGLPAAARIQLEGTLTSSDTSGLEIGGGLTTFELTRDGSTVFAASVDTATGSLTMSFDDVLPPGNYRVVAHGDGVTHVSSGFDFLLVGNPVPVPLLPPGAAVGLAALLIGFAGRRLRRR